MKNRKIVITIVFIGILFSIVKFWGGVSEFHPKEAYVISIIDGDTIEFSNGEKVRYIGIDTPELGKYVEGDWIYCPSPYAEEAKQFNQKLAEGRYVRLEFDVQKKDVYDRLLAYVYTKETMVNLEMLRQGYAMIYIYPPNVKYKDAFLAAQQYARENKKGMWGELEKDVISGSEAMKNIGFFKMVETEVNDTYLSDRVLILNCSHKFKIAIFKDNLASFPKIAGRSPDTYFKGKHIKVYGLIKEYKGSAEIVANHPSQLEIIE